MGCQESTRAIPCQALLSHRSFPSFVSAYSLVHFRDNRMILTVQKLVEPKPM